jgi:hypothetical protein
MFEFDLFCPADYPNVPPKVRYKRNGYGRRDEINPNISIQAMIFYNNPQSNEPGYSAALQPFSPNSGFNQNIRRMVINERLLDWAPKLWRDVANLHFKKNGDKILQTVGLWALTALATYGSSPFLNERSRRMARGVGMLDRHIWQVAPELKKALQAYGATYQLQNLDGRYAQQQPVHGMYGYGGGRFGGGGMDGGGFGPMGQFGAGSWRY